MKRLASVLIAATLLTGCAAQTPAGPSEADARYAKCVKGATDDYKVQYGEAHYRDNATKIDRMIADRCENARK
jgi:PBP1b-binding outer membrane lipoprotein LpoB